MSEGLTLALADPSGTSFDNGGWDKASLSTYLEHHYPGMFYVASVVDSIATVYPNSREGADIIRSINESKETHE